MLDSFILASTFFCGVAFGACVTALACNFAASEEDKEGTNDYDK